MKFKKDKPMIWDSQHYYSQDHSDPELPRLLGSYPWVQ